MLSINLLIQDSTRTALLSAAIIIGYFLLKWLKQIIINNVIKKGTKFFNIIFNILIYGSLVIGVMFAINFNSKDFFESVEEMLAKNSNALIWSAIVIIVASTVYNTVKAFITKPRTKHVNDEKRVKTVTKVIVSILRYITYIIVIIIVLKIWGIDLMPILAGLGIAGLVIGLGVQKLIGDFIAGLFIIFERHFDVGDYVQIGDFRGEVIDIGLKTTKIANWKGEILVIANGDITDLINCSQRDATASIYFTISYDTDIDNIIAILNEELPKFYKNDNHVTKKPWVAGVSDLGVNGVQIQINVSTFPEEQYGYCRSMRQHVKNILDNHQIIIPLNQIIIHQEDRND